MWICLDAVDCESPCRDAAVCLDRIRTIPFRVVRRPIPSATENGCCCQWPASHNATERVGADFSMLSVGVFVV